MSAISRYEGQTPVQWRWALRVEWFWGKRLTVWVPIPPVASGAAHGGTER